MKCAPVSAGNSLAQTTSTTSLARHPARMASTAGPLSATAKTTTRSPRATYRAIWSATTTWTTTAPGVMSPNTATFGIPLRLNPDGLPTATAIGTGSARRAGTALSILDTSARNLNDVNARNVNAVTVAIRNACTNGKAINRGATRLTAASLRGAQVTTSVGIKPPQRSSPGSVNIRPHVATPPAAVQ